MHIRDVWGTEEAFQGLLLLEKLTTVRFENLQNFVIDGRKEESFGEKSWGAKKHILEMIMWNMK